MKKELLIVYNYVFHYRKALFNHLSGQYNITLLHSGKKTATAEDNYTEQIIPAIKVGPLYFQRGVVSKVRREKYDAVIFFFEVRWISTLIAFISARKRTKRILWGAWFTNNHLANRTRTFFWRKADASILYTYKAKQECVARGIDEDKLFVANNTFDVGTRFKAYDHSNKSTVLFVGSFDPRKQNDILIHAFGNVLDKIPSDIKLVLIGDGRLEEELKQLVIKQKLSHRVSFPGRITEPDILRSYYNEAVISVSFGQAGLSVLQCLGFGVPFMTKRNAITGGEITNLKHGHNGILCEDSMSSLEENLVRVCNDIEYARELGRNAFLYYTQYCTIENMSEGFVDAIENVRNSVVDTNP